jgi:hypothetical protein
MPIGDGRFSWLRIGAESVAIVASILLAFAIDAWYERTVEQRLEVDYTRRITDELMVIKSAMQRELDGVRRSIEEGEYASAFFDGRTESLASDRLVASLYYFGLDSLQIFDLSVYEDLISSGRLGLISDLDRRASIQRAYLLVSRLQMSLSPFRSEYLAAVRGWIPQSIVTRLRDACPGRAGFDCQTIDLEDEETREILEKVSGDQARLAFRLRQQGLASLVGIHEQASTAVDDALALL